MSKASFSGSWKKSGRHGYSLVELLVTMGILSTLIMSSAHLTVGLHDADHKKALVHISNAIELARQVAVSRNTYTYVGFTTPAAPHDDNAPLCVAVFQSSAGDNVVRRCVLEGNALPAESEAAGQDGWSMVTKPEWLKNIVCDNAAEQTDDISELIPALAVSQNRISYMGATASPEGVAFEILRQTGSMSSRGVLRFDRLMTFCPNGAVMVDNTTGIPANSIGFVVRSSRGASPSNLEKTQSAAFLISGLIGNVQIYQR